MANNDNYRAEGENGRKTDGEAAGRGRGASNDKGMRVSGDNKRMIGAKYMASRKQIGKTSEKKLFECQEATREFACQLCVAASHIHVMILLVGGSRSLNSRGQSSWGDPQKMNRTGLRRRIIKSAAKVSNSLRVVLCALSDNGQRQRKRRHKDNQRCKPITGDLAYPCECRASARARKCCYRRCIWKAYIVRFGGRPSKSRQDFVSFRGVTWLISMHAQAMAPTCDLSIASFPEKH